MNSLIQETMSIIIKQSLTYSELLFFLYYEIINAPTNKLFYILINTWKKMVQLSRYSLE